MQGPAAIIVVFRLRNTWASLQIGGLELLQMCYDLLASRRELRHWDRMSFRVVFR